MNRLCSFEDESRRERVDFSGEVEVGRRSKVFFYGFRWSYRRRSGS